MFNTFISHGAIVISPLNVTDCFYNTHLKSLSIMWCQFKLGYEVTRLTRSPDIKHPLFVLFDHIVFCRYVIFFPMVLCGYVSQAMICPIKQDFSLRMNIFCWGCKSFALCLIFSTTFCVGILRKKARTCNFIHAGVLLLVCFMSWF